MQLEFDSFQTAKLWQADPFSTFKIRSVLLCETFAVTVSGNLNQFPHFAAASWDSWGRLNDALSLFYAF